MLLLKPAKAVVVAKSQMSIDKSLAPLDVNELSTCLRDASTSGSFAIVSWSSSSKSAGIARPANLQKPHRVLDLSKLDGIIEHRPEDQVICVETGIELAKLDELLAKHNQWLPLSAPLGTRLSEVIERGDGGCLEHGFGGPRDLVLGMDVVLSSGLVIKTGGKVVKNVTGYDLTKLFIGSRGTLGIVASANLRLFARPNSWRFLLLQDDSPVTLLETAQAVVASGLPVTCMELVDAQWMQSKLVALERRFGLIIAVSGHEEVVHEIVEQMSSLIEAKHSNIEAPAHDVLQALDEIAVAGTTSGDTVIESTLTLSELVYGIKTWWQSAGQPHIFIRPGSGRIRMRVAGDGARNLLDLLENTYKASKNGSFLTVAISDNECEHKLKIIHLPAQSDSVRRISEKLKSKFDKHQMLNPQIVLW